MRIYINGVLVDSAARNGTFPTKDINFVLGTINMNEAFAGDIDNVIIWDVVRTAAQISNSRNCENQYPKKRCNLNDEC